MTMRYFPFLLLLLTYCSGVSDSDSEFESNEPGVLILSIPEVIQMDSTYSLPLEVADPDGIKSVTVREQINNGSSQTEELSAGGNHLDTILTRSFGETGVYEVTVTVVDRHKNPETLTESYHSEIVESVEVRTLVLRLLNPSLETEPRGVGVKVFDSGDRLLAEGTVENGTFEFQKHSAEGRQEIILAEFYGHGYIDFKENITHQTSGEFEIVIQPAPIEIPEQFPKLTAGEITTVDVRDLVTSVDPDSSETVDLERVEFSDHDELRIEEKSEFIFDIEPWGNISENAITAQITVYTATNMETKVIEFPVEGAVPINQTADTITGTQGQSTEFEIADYFSSSSPFTLIEFTPPSEITVDDLGSGIYRLSQPDNVTGSHTIGVRLENGAGSSLESELTYQISGTVPGRKLIIMPLGNSLTNDGRSRAPIWQLLIDDGHEVDFVGDQYQQGIIPDPDHEGVGGITIQGIIDKAESLMRRHNPEFVNLMVGTNDIAWYTDEDVPDIAARWNELVQILLDSSSPETYIVAATIPPVTSRDTGREGRDRAVLVREYNDALRNYIEARKESGDLIVLADVEANLNLNDHLSSDGVHLNEEGYTIMGTVYYEAIRDILANE